MEKNIGESMEEKFKEFFKSTDHKWSEQAARMLSPLQLAYLGDAVYDLIIRTSLVDRKKLPVNELHKEAVKYVKANSQAKILFSLEDMLTEEEWGIVKRGRNAKSATVPKNANLSDYRYATGFEALIGYLFITGNTERIFELLNSMEI